MTVKRGYLRYKIIAWSFIPTAFILVGVALIHYASYRQVTQELVMQRNQELARLLANRLGSGLTVYTDLLESLANSLRSSPTGQQAALMDANELLSVFDGGLLVLNDEGVVIADYPYHQGLIGSDWSSSPLFKQSTMPAARPRPYVSDIGQLGTDESPVIWMSFPILDSFGQSKGVLAGLFHLQTIPENAFYATIAQLKLEAHGSAYLVDGNGRVIYHTATDKIGADFSEREVAREVLFGNEGSMRTIDSQGQDVVASYAPVPGTRWGLVTQESWQALLGSSQTYAQFLLLLIALGVVIPAVVVALGVRRITQPIADLTRAAQDVASGHFGQTIVAHTGDELETLAEQFNIMSLELQDSYANLENRVADRTRELDTINKISSVVSRSLDLDKILGDALETACLALNLKQGSIMLFGDHQEASTQVSRGFGEDLQADMIRFPFIETVAHQAVRAREPVVQKFQGDSNSANGLSQADLNCDLLVSVPIQSKGQVLGVLNLCSDSQRAFKPEELEMLKAIGNHIGIGIENARLYKQAEHSAALAERNRLARDLHDAVSQTLFSASMIAEVLPRIWERDPQEGRRDLEQLRLLTRGALAEMRTLLLELRPAALADSDLGDLIRQLAESITGRTELAVHLELGLEGVLPLEVKVALYRICQEALNNVIKHAEASGVSISLYADPQEAELCIADDGAGFDPEIRLPGHLGLGIIQERAASIGASLAWESHPGSGTELKVNWLSGTEEDL